MPYALAEGYNALSLTNWDDITVDGASLSHVTSLGTFATGREIETLDGVMHDDGFEEWQWLVVAMTPAELDYLSVTFLDGARSGPVTAETRKNNGVFVERNAIMTLPRLPILRGEKYSDVIIQFRRGEPTA